MKTKLRLESLESRDCPSASISLYNGLLSIVGDQRGLILQVDRPDAATVRVLADGVSTFFPAADITNIDVTGGAGFNDLNLLGVAFPATIRGGNAGNNIEGSTGPTTIYGGLGQDKVYDILGTNFIDVSQGTPAIQVFKGDSVYTNDASTVLLKRNDVQVRFFAANRLPGAGTVVVDQGVLYITPGNNGSNTSLVTVGQNYVLTYDFFDGMGPQTRTFSQKAFAAVGFFGGQGDDFYRNDTNRSEIAYGQGGNDTLIGSVNSYFSFLKGGAGDDYLEGRANDGTQGSKPNDLQGNGGADTLVLGASLGGTFHIDQFDVIRGNNKGDLVIGP